MKGRSCGPIDASLSKPWAASRGNQIHHNKTRAVEIEPKWSLKENWVEQYYHMVTYHTKEQHWASLLQTDQHPSHSVSDRAPTKTRWEKEQAEESSTLEMLNPLLRHLDLTCDLHWPLHVHTCVSVSLLTVWITAILLTLFVLVEWELSCKDEILFTFVIEWLWRERKHGANRYICHVHADKTTACR